MSRLLIAFFFTATLVAQSNKTMELPFNQIPQAEVAYSSGNIVKRMVDGLGYRYYWATEGLRAEDLAFKPSEDSRSAQQTLEHLYGLSEMIVDAAQNKPNVRPSTFSAESFAELREATLNNLEEASKALTGLTEQQIAALEVVFESNGKRTAFPFWNMLNGPLADALYHTGQIVSFRRVSGNPMNPKVNVFMGRNND